MTPDLKMKYDHLPWFPESQSPVLFNDNGIKTPALFFFLGLVYE